MEKFFDFEEAINCLKNEIEVKRVGNDGKTRVYYVDDKGNLHCKIGKYNYVVPFNELFTATNWTYNETNNK